MNVGIIQHAGFVWLAYPREALMPLTLLEKSSTSMIHRLASSLFGLPDSGRPLAADIFSLFPKPKRGMIPGVSEPKDASELMGSDIVDLKAGIGAVTNKQIPMLGKAEIQSHFSHATKLHYSFKDVKHISVDNEIALEEYLNVQKPLMSAPGYLEKLQNGKLFIVTEVLQATEFKVGDASDFEFDSTVSADAIKKYMELKASQHYAGSSNFRIESSGNKPLTFALKAAKILYNREKNIYTLNTRPLAIVRGNSQNNESQKYREFLGQAFEETIIDADISGN